MLHWLAFTVLPSLPQSPMLDNLLLISSHMCFVVFNAITENKVTIEYRSMSANASGSSSLRPAWYKGAGGGGGRGFQPPPTVTSERGEKTRSSSWGTQERRDSNKFSALQDDEDGPPNQGSGGKEEKPSGNSRSEAFRSSFNRSSSTGERAKPPGRSLADLAARVPDTGAGGRRHSSGFEGRGGGGTGRFSGLRPGDSSSSGLSGSDPYKSDSKVIRYTREKLLSMRPPPKSSEEGPPADLKHMEGTVVLSKVPQDPGKFYSSWHINLFVLHFWLIFNFTFNCQFAGIL